MPFSIDTPAWMRSGFSSQEEFDEWRRSQEREIEGLTPPDETFEESLTESPLRVVIDDSTEPEQVDELADAPSTPFNLATDRPDLFAELTGTEESIERFNLAEERPDLFAELTGEQATPERMFDTPLYPSRAEIDHNAYKAVAIRSIEAFTGPILSLTNMALDVTLNPVLSALGQPRAGFTLQSQFLEPPQSRTEEILTVGGTSVGTIMSFWMPMSGAARLHSAVTPANQIRGELSDAVMNIIPRYTTPPPGSVTRGVNPDWQQLNIAQRAANDLPYLSQTLRATPEVMLRTYQTRPINNAFIETGFAFGAGTGAMAMEAIFPGDPTARTYGEIIGGFGPAPLMARAASDAPSKFADVIRRFSGTESSKLKLARQIETAIQSKARETYLLENPDATVSRFTAAGREGMEDVQRITDDVVGQMVSDLEFALRFGTQNQDGITLTSGLTTGNRHILEFENLVLAKNPALAQKRKEATESAFKAYDNYIANELASGDPTRVRDAAHFAYARYKDIIDNQLVLAQKEAADAVAKLQTTDSKTASEKAYEIISISLANARATEGRLWRAIPDVNPYVTSSTSELGMYGYSVRAFGEISRKMTVTDAKPFAGDFQKMRQLRRAQEQGLSEADLAEVNLSPYTAQQMIELRGRLLEEGRATIQKYPKKAQRYYELADAVKEDLLALDAISGEYNRARAFSNALKSKWNDTFANKVSAAVFDERGVLQEPDPKALSVPTENLLSAAFGAGGYQGVRRFRELEGAAVSQRFRGDEITLDSSVYGPEVRSAQEDFLRYRVAQMLNDDGTIKLSNIQRFLNDADHADILMGMPLLYRDLTDAATTAQTLQSVLQSNKANIRELKNSAIGSLIGKTAPNRVIATMLNSADAGKNIQELVAAANLYKDADLAKQGLLHAMLTFAKNGASTRDMTSYSRFKNILQTEVSPGEPSLERMILDNGLYTPEQYGRFMEYIDRGVALESALTRPEVMESLGGQIDPMTDLVVRITGAKLGGRLASVIPGAGGQGLIPAAAGSGYLRGVFNDMPLMKLQMVAEHMVRDPVFFREVMLTRYTPQNREELQRRTNLFLLKAGIYSQDELEERDHALTLFERE